MKYTRLTKEQFEELHIEFAKFLASQSIDKKEWEELKLNKPEVAEQELDVFSDLIWEGALNKIQFLEHISKNHIFLFNFETQTAKSIIVKTLDQSVDFTSKEGLDFLQKNLSSELVEINFGSKNLTDRNTEVFKIIQQGALTSNGELYNSIKKLIS